MKRWRGEDGKNTNDGGEEEAEEEPQSKFFPSDTYRVFGVDFSERHRADDHGGGLSTGVASGGDDHGKKE